MSKVFLAGPESKIAGDQFRVYSGEGLNTYTYIDKLEKGQAEAVAEYCNRVLDVMPEAHPMNVFNFVALTALYPRKVAANEKK